MESISDATCANSFYLLFSLWNSKFPFVVFTASALNSQINLSSMNVSTLAHCLIRQYTYGCSDELHCPMPRIHNTGLETFLLQVWIYSSWTHWIFISHCTCFSRVSKLYFSWPKLTPLYHLVRFRVEQRFSDIRVCVPLIAAQYQDFCGLNRVVQSDLRICWKEPILQCLFFDPEREREKEGVKNT